MIFKMKDDLKKNPKTLKEEKLKTITKSGKKHINKLENKLLEEYNNKRDRIYKIMFKILTSPSKRSRIAINKEFNLDKEDYSLLKNIFDAKNHSDFIPTPTEFQQPFLETLENKLKYDKPEDFHILEPSCGLGYVIHNILKLAPNIKITAYEFNYSLYEILLKLFPKNIYPNITFYHKNFLLSDNKNDYNFVFCNPPFTNGTNKRYYLNFFYKLSKMLNNNDSEWRENLLYFISPPLFPDMQQKFNRGHDYIDSYDLLTPSSFLTKKRIEEIINENVSNKEFNNYKKEFKGAGLDHETMEEYIPYQTRILSNINFTAGTKFSAYSYEGICMNN